MQIMHATKYRILLLFGLGPWTPNHIPKPSDSSSGSQKEGKKLDASGCSSCACNTSKK